ncbi:MAG: hypothetical protein EZS28_006692 [Streblomastix strix]|uniref:Fido domain-containing protein n=1 Tax=Streblomastix strix TaxID=222440 RepID=A0A5J4WS79_9EUKA|nr:MAG: hypothetical protein EZS28_006692 [Streblomastix strix]
MFNDDGCDQISKITDTIDADRLMYKNIMDSNCIEQDILPKDYINDAIEYLKSNEVPQIEGLYQALFKREVFRHCSVYVSDKNNSKIISAANVGIQHENIDPNELQKLVDFVYEYDQPNKVMVLFACYLLYERIHPHEDGNDCPECLESDYVDQNCILESWRIDSKQTSVLIVLSVLSL